MELMQQFAYVSGTCGEGIGVILKTLLAACHLSKTKP